MRLLTLWLCLICILPQRCQVLGLAVSSGRGSIGVGGSPSNLWKELQTHSLDVVLDRVGRWITPHVDPTGDLARLILVRLSKQLICNDNLLRHVDAKQKDEQGQQLLLFPTSEIKSSVGFNNDEFAYYQVLDSVVNSLLEIFSQKSDKLNTEILVEGTKAFAIIARLLPELDSSRMQNFWMTQANRIVPSLKDHEVSGIYWALETIAYANHKRKSLSNNRMDWSMPDAMTLAWDELNLPFHIELGLLSDIPLLSVPNLRQEVDFQMDQICTASNQVVQERRETCWQGDLGVAPFLYGGKSMPTKSWSPTVLGIRNQLSGAVQGLGKYYDCCLINHYIDGGSGMRYHADPDQGILWDYDTAVVSVGAARRFAFRPKRSAPNSPDHDKNHHSFVVFHGDVTHMFDQCQQDYQHCVKKSELKLDDAARISLVFKQSWPLPPTAL